MTIQTCTSTPSRTQDCDSYALSAQLLANEVLYDASGMPNVMVPIPMFRLSDIWEGAPDVPHPAFIVRGEVKPVIYVSKYLASTQNGCAVSLPMVEPKNLVTYPQAQAYCEAKGPGWHLMTNAEWAAIALMCQKNAHLPHGNCNHGADEFCPWEHGVPIDGFSEQAKQSILTGSGPLSWSHNADRQGIWDLHGNLYEWLSGMRLVDGEIQIIPNNDAAVGSAIDQSANSTLWRAILPSGELVTPGTAGALHYDCSVTMPDKGEIPFHISNAQENPAPTSESNNSAYGKVAFETLRAKDGVSIPDILKVLCLAPIDDTPLGGDAIYMRSTGERMLRRGGYWGTGENGGLMCINLNYERTFLFHGDGFRACYIKP